MFTVMNSISASGIVLPIQVIYARKTAMVLPKCTPENVMAWDDIKKTNAIHFDWSGNNGYWSTMHIMKIYVNNVLVPYFTAAKEELGLLEIQLCIWQIDCWLVYRSEEFRVWMAAEHPNIQLKYMPGGCTGLWQVCDIGIQRVFKHAICQAAQADMIAETLLGVEKNVISKNISAIHLSKSLPVIRNWSVRWLNKAYLAVNNPTFVRKVCML